MQNEPSGLIGLARHSLAIIVAVCLAVICNVEAKAQIYRLPDVPEPLKPMFQATHDELALRLQKLQADAREFRARCPPLPKGSEESENCRRERDGLEQDRNTYNHGAKILAAGIDFWLKAKHCGECSQYLFAAYGEAQREAANVTPEALYYHYELSRRFYEVCNQKFENQCSGFSPSGHFLYQMTESCSSYNPANSRNRTFAAGMLKACIKTWADDEDLKGKAQQEDSGNR